MDVRRQTRWQKFCDTVGPLMGVGLLVAGFVLSFAFLMG